LLDIWHYFADGASPDLADTLLRNIERVSIQLADRPFSGGPRTDISPGVRSILAHPYVIIYRVTAATIEIARVLHERRDVATAFKKRPP
jgi:plasmid stabilization system protein ParE